MPDQDVEFRPVAVYEPHAEGCTCERYWFTATARTSGPRIISFGWDGLPVMGGIPCLVVPCAAICGGSVRIELGTLGTWLVGELAR